jgi:hypothetical protein
MSEFTIMNNNKVHLVPPPLKVPTDKAFKGYTINTNGLKETSITIDGETRKLSKTKIILDLINSWDLDVIHLIETHDYQLEDTMIFGDWSPNQSKQAGGIHGTATVTKEDPKELSAATNVAVSEIEWEKQTIVLVSAYFPNREEGTIKTIKMVDRILSINKGKRIILTGDFNATETESSSDAGGVKAPSVNRRRRAGFIHQLLDKWRLKDLWKLEDNPHRWKETRNLDHLTHWNHEMTRGVRIDRTYSNFMIEGKVEISTHSHPGSDHKGVKYLFSNPSTTETHINMNKPLPHRAFELEATRKVIFDRITKWETKHSNNPNALNKWDKTKRAIKEESIAIWERHVRNRGKELKKLRTATEKSEGKLKRMDSKHPARERLREAHRINNTQYLKALSKDQEGRKEASTTKWIRIAGKPNKDFLARPRGGRKRIANMTVENRKDEPDLPRTNDINVILENFVNYYGELYAHKKVNKTTLDRLIQNLTLTLTDKERATLDSTIGPEEIMKAILETPKNKSPGLDRLTYECWKACPQAAARIDLINAKNEEGAVIFLDQEKAFDRVSFTTVNRIFEQVNWPGRFRALLSTIYHKNNIRAKIKANGVISDSDFAVNSGTRQGCPLSPLIYAVVADLFNRAVIAHPEFRGHPTSGGVSTKISAFADDTAVHVGNIRDIVIYKRTNKSYSDATGGLTNFTKSKAVVCGGWIGNPPDLGVEITNAAKYLGVITGDDADQTNKCMSEREDRIYKQLDYWDARLSSSPPERVMIAKIMCLSLVWYHAGLMPGWDKTLERIEKRVNTFIWKGTIPKVAKDTLILPKNEGGLDVWDLKAKTNGFVNMWIVKLLTGATNPLLKATFTAITELYAERAETQTPLWESRIDHSANIIKHTGSKLLAMFQQSWSTVVRRDPVLNPGDWVKYSNDVERRKRFADQFYEGKAQVIAARIPEGSEVPVDWFDQNDNQGPYLLNNPEGEEQWHLPTKKCYKIDATTGNLQESRPEELYIVVGRNEDTGLKMKVYIDQILTEEEDKITTELYSPQFLKKTANSKLYKAQLLRTRKTYIKSNKWVEKYNINLRRARNLHNGTYAQSKIKGFMWLFISHALPVGTRLRGKDSDPACPHCGRDEDIRHMAFGCKIARKTRELAFKEWSARSGDLTWLWNQTFKESFFISKNDTASQRAKNTLNDIVTYHVWKHRCDKFYGRSVKSITPETLANNAWIEFERTLTARIKYIEEKADWWTTRKELAITSEELADNIINRIQDECHILSALQSPWYRSPKYSIQAEDIQNVWITRAQGADPTGVPVIPPTISVTKWNWRLSTSRKPHQRSILGTHLSLDVGEEETRNSTSTSEE